MLIGSLVARKAMSRRTTEDREWAKCDVAKARRKHGIAAYHAYIAREVRRLTKEKK